MAAYGYKNAVRNEIVSKLKSNMTLLKFLYYVDDLDADITTLPNLTASQIRDVVDNYIYKYEKVEANTETDKRCYISMNYGLKQYHAQNNHYFNGNTFNLYIVCERAIDYLTQHGSRMDAIEQCIADMFDYGEVGCTGNSKVDYSEPISIKGSDYICTHISIIFYDKQGL